MTRYDPTVSARLPAGEAPPARASAGGETLALSDDLRDLIALLAEYETNSLGDSLEHAKSAAKVDEQARRIPGVRALWTAAETGTVPPEHLADVVRLVRDERDWNIGDLAEQCDHLQAYIIRGEPGYRYSDDRGETLAVYREQIGQRRRDRARCDEFLTLAGAVRG